MSSVLSLELLYCGEAFGGELGTAAFAKLYFATGASTISQAFIEKLGKAYGFEYSCFIMSGIFLISAIITQTLPTKPKFKKELQKSII